MPIFPSILSIALVPNSWLPIRFPDRRSTPRTPEILSELGIFNWCCLPLALVRVLMLLSSRPCHLRSLLQFPPLLFLWSRRPCLTGAPQLLRRSPKGKPHYFFFFFKRCLCLATCTRTSSRYCFLGMRPDSWLLGIDSGFHRHHHLGRRRRLGCGCRLGRGRLASIHAGLPCARYHSCFSLTSGSFLGA